MYISLSFFPRFNWMDKKKKNHWQENKKDPHWSDWKGRIWDRLQRTQQEEGKFCGHQSSCKSFLCHFLVQTEFSFFSFSFFFPSFFERN
jgi:hypothetical protein